VEILWKPVREGSVEKSLVQILVVVVITKLRTFWTEVEKGFG